MMRVKRKLIFFFPPHLKSNFVYFSFVPVRALVFKSTVLEMQLSVIGVLVIRKKSIRLSVTRYQLSEKILVPPFFSSKKSRPEIRVYSCPFVSIRVHSWLKKIPFWRTVLVPCNPCVPWLINLPFWHFDMNHSPSVIICFANYFPLRSKLRFLVHLFCGSLVLV